MEWKYGPAKQQTNQSSTKSKCLCFVVLIDGCVALVAALHFIENEMSLWPLPAEGP